MAQPFPDNSDTRQGMIDTCLWMNGQGINQGTSGNISVRSDAGLLITPSGMAYDAMDMDDIVCLPFDGLPPDGLRLRPSSEWRFHQRLHQARPDMPVVLHAHPPHATAIAMQRRVIPACHYMVAAFGGHDVPLAGYALFGSDALADEVATAMANRTACLMANHGATVIGETLARARWRMQELETLSRTFLLSQTGGEPYILSNAEIEEALAAFATYGPK